MEAKYKPEKKSCAFKITPTAMKIIKTEAKRKNIRVSSLVENMILGLKYKTQYIQGLTVNKS